MCMQGSLLIFDENVEFFRLFCYSFLRLIQMLLLLYESAEIGAVEITCAKIGHIFFDMVRGKKVCNFAP